VGRRTLALRLAQAANCLTPPQAGDFCGACRPCKLIADMRHPDLEVVEAEQRSGVLRVEQIRELQHRLSLAPYEASYRVALLLRFEEANLNAQNALLKTLEEPPQRVLIFITTEDSESLLPTIVSRCEVIHLRPLPPTVLAQTLIETQGSEPTFASQIARLSGGRPGLALQLLHQPEKRQTQQRIIEQHLALLSASYLDRFALAERLAKEKSKAEIVSLLEYGFVFWRDVLLCACGDHNHLTYQELLEPLMDIAAQLGSAESLQALSRLRQTLDHLQGNVNVRLALEVLFLNLPRLRFSSPASQVSLETPQI